MQRRQLLQLSLSTLLALKLTQLPAASLSPPKKVLVLGGTDFLGPLIVQELIDRGHDVTLLNRGKTNPHLFPNLKRIKADREQENQQGMTSLINSDEQWDWVVDTWQKSPIAVKDAAEILKNRTANYQYVSTISVYDDWRQINITEEAELNAVPDMPTDFGIEHRYAIRKTLSELTLQAVLGDKFSSFRSHGLRGSSKRTVTSSEPYWPIKVMRGGPVVLPAAAEYYQVTDMISLAKFMVSCGENNHLGPFNVAYPPFKFRDYIAQLKKLTGSNAKFEWLPQNFLEVNGAEIYSTNRAGRYRFNVDRAYSHGLRNRHIIQLNIDQIKGYLERHPKDDYEFGGTQSHSLSKDREIELIKQWNQEKLRLEQALNT